MTAVSANPPRGRLTVIHGSMFAGKTEQLIARLRTEQAGGRRVLAVKHTIDDRYAPDHLVTHPGDRFPAVHVRTAAAILEQAVDVDTIAVDEGQFFKMALIPVVRTLLNRGIAVLVAGLSHDAWGRPFEPIPELAAQADEVIVCESPCRVCGQPSPYTQRITPVNTEFMVGGLGDYEPRCADHFSPLPGPPEQR